MTSKRPHVPHDQLTPGYWYVHHTAAPGYIIVSVSRLALGRHEGELGVWMMDEEGYQLTDVFDEDQFIGPVPAPEGRL